MINRQLISHWSSRALKTVWEERHTLTVKNLKYVMKYMKTDSLNVYVWITLEGWAPVQDMTFSWAFHHFWQLSHLNLLLAILLINYNNYAQLYIIFFILRYSWITDHLNDHTEILILNCHFMLYKLYEDYHMFVFVIFYTHDPCWLTDKVRYYTSYADNQINSNRLDAVTCNIDSWVCYSSESVFSL